MRLHVCILAYVQNVFAIESIVQELSLRGHVPRVLSPLDCSVKITQGKLSLVSRGTAIENVNVVLTRCVAYFHCGRPISLNLEAAAALALMNHGSIAINRPHCKLLASDKALSLARLASCDIKVPPTTYLNSPAELQCAMKGRSHPSVLKLTEGMWGTGVMRVDSEPSFRSVTEAFVAQGQSVLIQPYLASKSSRQLRVLVLGDTVLAAYESRPADGDFRSNLHTGATSTMATVPQDIVDVAVASTKALDLDFAGVDIIADDEGTYVLEVNPSPGFEFSRDRPEFGIARSLVDYLERAAEKSRL